MDITGEQLHSNWRALATVHIPLKRFIKEGTAEVRKGTLNSREKNRISGIKCTEIKEFYEELVNNDNERKEHKCIERAENKETIKGNVPKSPTKHKFESKNFFRFAMENKVNDLKTLDYNDQDVNVCDAYGWSGLMIASCEGAKEAVEFLLALGVDKYIKDKAGNTAKDLAVKKGHLKIVELLENNGQMHTKETVKQKVETLEPFYCEICKQNFKETTKNKHFASTLHQFSKKSEMPTNKLQKFNISSRNKGLQLMVKQGWDKESGLGPSQSGRLYPVKTVIRKQRTGLGIGQDAARVTHFESFDLKAVQRHNSDYYKKKPRNRNDIRREKVREWKRDRRLRNELN